MNNNDEALAQLNDALARLASPAVAPIATAVEWEPIPGLKDQVRRKDWKAGVWEDDRGEWAAGVPSGPDGIGYNYNARWGKSGFPSRAAAMTYADEQVAKEDGDE